MKNGYSRRRHRYVCSAASSRHEREREEAEGARKRLIDHRELDAKLKRSKGELPSCILINAPYLLLVREELKDLTKEYDKSEEDLKALQSGVGQIVGEVLRQLSEDKCVPSHPSLLPSVPSSPSPSFPPSFLLSLPPLHTSLSSFYSLSPSHS